MAIDESAGEYCNSLVIGGRKRQVPPVDGVKIYPGGTWIVSRTGTPGTRPIPTGDGKIRLLSRKSRERLLMIATETGVQFRSMATLTYGRDYPGEGTRVKADLNRFLNYVRRCLKCEYLWFLEFQRRGAPHIHILLSVSSGDRYEFAKRWTEIASDDWQERIKIFKVHSHPDQWQDARSETGMVRYVAKYATKTAQKVVPANYQNVGRFWGVSSGVRSEFPDPVEIKVTEQELREYLEAAGHRVADWEVLPRVIFGV